MFRLCAARSKKVWLVFINCMNDGVLEYRRMSWSSSGGRSIMSMAAMVFDAYNRLQSVAKTNRWKLWFFYGSLTEEARRAEANL